MLTLYFEIISSSTTGKRHKAPNSDKIKNNNCIIFLSASSLFNFSDRTSTLHPPKKEIWINLTSLPTYVPGEVVVIVGMLEVVVPGLPQLAPVVVKLLVVAQLRQLLQRKIQRLPQSNVDCCLLHKQCCRSESGRIRLFLAGYEFARKKYRSEKEKSEKTPWPPPPPFGPGLGSRTNHV